MFHILSNLQNYYLNINKIQTNDQTNELESRIKVLNFEFWGKNYHCETKKKLEIPTNQQQQKSEYPIRKTCVCVRERESVKYITHLHSKK